MGIDQGGDLWWKNAVFYCLDIETFQDSDGDGSGDFQGLARRLDHLAGLGVDCLWLMPFYPSPNRDDGYDIADYYSVDPRLGSLGDFVEVVRMARARGLRVIADLVVNHTSREHPWFQASRSDPASSYRDWYVWRDAIPKDGPEGIVFPDEENSNWAWDETAKAYYLHRFYKHQPDLNVANPAVRAEIRRIVGFWLELGLSGFRVDAVPFLLETAGMENPEDFAPHDWLRDLRAFMGRRRGDAILLGEVNLLPEGVRRFFGDEDGDELHMCLNFNLNQAMALSLVRGDAGPIVHSLRTLPSLPEESAWANFVRNHDEWSLDKLTEAERDEAFKAFGPKPAMQLFGRGLRRRLPTMLDGDQARIRMTYALNAALPGAAVLFYGEEIGMAENLDIEGRMSVRSPMQWTAGKTAGFSTATPKDLRRPVVPGKRWGPESINVADQRRDRDSLLHWMTALIRVRRETPLIGLAKPSVLDAAEPAVLALCYDDGEAVVVAVHNLGAKPVKTSLGLGEPGWAGCEDRFGAGDFSLAEDGTLDVALDGYGYRWLCPVRSTTEPKGRA